MKIFILMRQTLQSQFPKGARLSSTELCGSEDQEAAGEMHGAASQFIDPLPPHRPGEEPPLPPPQGLLLANNN